MQCFVLWDINFKGPEFLSITTRRPFLSVNDFGRPAGVTASSLVKPHACLTAATQRGCQPVTQGPCVNSRGKKKKRRRGRSQTLL